MTIINDNSWLLKNFDEITDEKVTMLPSELAELKRVIPSGLSPAPGPYRNDFAPYVKEILDCFHPDHPAQEVAWMKGTQICATVGSLENIILFYIDIEPAAIMYGSADQKLAETSIDLRIDRMIDACGIRHKIFSQSEKKNNRKSGDKKCVKEFAGGFLLAGSAQSEHFQRTMTIRILLLDEIDGVEKEVKKKGSFIKNFQKRTNAHDSDKKILYISTPGNKLTSNINPLFEMGDKRYYFVPCLKCGTMQILTFKQLKYDLNELGNLIQESVYYKCIHCENKMKNYDKVDMLGAGEWRPTAKSKKPRFRSYHLSSLYSPVGFMSWESVSQEFIEAERSRKQGSLLDLKSFVTLTLGEPWEERNLGDSPNPDLISVSNAKQYFKGEIPNREILFLTCGADVQGDRVEFEIVGWGKGMKSWSIDYLKVKGTKEDIKDPYSKLWNDFESIITKNFYYTGMTKALNLQMVFIDSRFEGSAVQEFCGRLKNVYPIMGVSGWRKWKNVYQAYKLTNGLTRYDLCVDELKDTVYNQLKRGIRDDNEKLPPGYCSFPINYDKFFYRMLTAEEKIIDTNKDGRAVIRWSIPKDRRNEALDCRVYALAAVYVYASIICLEEFGFESIEWPTFWDYVENMRNKELEFND